MDILDIIRSILLTKKVKGVEIANALRSISHCYGDYTQRLTSDVDGKRTYNIGILKDEKYPQTGHIIGSFFEDAIMPGITFTTKYPRGHKIIVANYRWDDVDYAEYDEKKVIEAVDSLRKDLAVKLL